MLSVLNALINISVEVDENKEILLDGGIISLLLPFVNSSDTNIWEKTVLLLCNICAIKSVEDKNSIINCGIFDIFHKKLLEISPFPPRKMISSNYFSISRIIIGIDNLLVSNRSGVTSFLKTPLIPLLLHTLDSISIEDTSSDDEGVENIQLYICRCFEKCSFHCYEDALLLVEMKVIDFLLNIIEKYINDIKILMNEETVKTISMIIFNMVILGSDVEFEWEKNKFKSYFYENNKLNKLLNLFKYLFSQTLSPIKKETINNISITICKLLKSEKPTHCYDCVLQYVNKLKSSPHPTSGYNYSSSAKDSWNEMLSIQGNDCY
jgi:hypothetical protein